MLALAPCESEGEHEGSYSLIESLEQPGKSLAFHRQSAWRETFIVLEGRFDFQNADVLP